MGAAEYGPTDSPYVFGVQTYEESPLGRELQQTGPGYAWHAGDKGIKTEYGFNAASRVRLYRTGLRKRCLENGSWYRETYYYDGSIVLHLYNLIK